MMLLLDVLSQPVWQRLTWTLLHFLWQGLGIAAILLAVFWLFRVRGARPRYVMSLLAMVLMALCPPITFVVLERSSERTAASDSTPEGFATLDAVGRQPSASHTAGPEAASAGRPADSGGTAEPNSTVADYVRPLHPYLLVGWIVGVFLLAGRLLLAQLGTRRIRRDGRPITAELAACVAQLGRRIGLPPDARVLGSEQIREAMVVGVLRPIVLLPAGWLTGMTPEILEAIIAHELAHIRRWDLWANLFQRLVETLLFYHPIVWWLSRRIRIEREMCCDELAVAVTGKRVVYATALEQAARRRADSVRPALGVAIGGEKMTLLDRVRNVLGVSSSHESARWWPAGLLALLVPLLTSASIAETVLTWEANPFTDVRTISVEQMRYMGKPETYLIDDPKTVASLIARLKIRGIQNDTSIGQVVSAWITFRKKDGTTRRVAVMKHDYLELEGNAIYVEPAFIVALNRHLTQRTGRKVDLIKFLPVRPEDRPPPYVAPSRRSLTAGIANLKVTYHSGEGLRATWIRQRKALDEIQQALKILEHEPDWSGKPRSTGFTLISKDGSQFLGRFLDEKQISGFKLGRFTVEPSFVETVNRHVSRIDGRKIDVLAENPLTERQLEGEREFRKLLATATAFRFPAKARGKSLILILPVTDPDQVAELIGGLDDVELPLKQRKLAKDDFFIEITTGGNKKIRLTYLQMGADHALVDSAPLMCDLVDVTGFGQIWLDNQWKYRFLHDVASSREQAIEEREWLATVEVVARDLPGFLKKVVSVTVSYREAGGQHHWSLPTDRSRTVIDALKIDKVQPLDWNASRWKAELTTLREAKAGILILTPGVGFDLPLVIVGEKEFLIPHYGRVTLKTDPIETIKKVVADDPDKPDSVGLLPL